MSSQPKLERCPVMIGVNVDTESQDVLNAGKGGLFGRHSYGRYGAREGIWRLLDEFQQLEVPATFFVVPDDALRHLHIIEAILKQGHEIAVRGKVKAQTSGASSLESLAQDRDTLQKITGVQPAGWRAVNGLVTEQTLPALADLGYVYDSSALDDDVPYVMRGSSGSRLVQLPMFDYLTDATFYTHRHTDARVRKAWAEEADAQYCAGGYINLTLHTRGDVGSSRLPRVQAVGDFIRTLGQRPGVAFYRATDLAHAWRDVFTSTEDFPVCRPPQINYPEP